MRKALRSGIRAIRKWLLRAVLVLGLLLGAWILLYRFVPVPTTPYMLAEHWRLGEVRRDWVPMDEIAPVLARSVVAAEDANFCRHWGFDMGAIREALEEGASRGASTISQQVVKNTFLWQGRSWLRKALEGVITPVVELAWPKRRILEVYLNIVEFDEGVFGAQEASRWYFGVDAKDLNASRAAALAVVLPYPKARSAIDPTPALKRRAARVADGAETIRRDGRASCFED